VPKGAISGPFVPAVINQETGHYDYYPYANQFMPQKRKDDEATEGGVGQYEGPFVKPAIYQPKPLP